MKLVSVDIISELSVSGKTRFSFKYLSSDVYNKCIGKIGVRSTILLNIRRAVDEAKDNS